MINEFEITVQDVADTQIRMASYLNSRVPGLNVRPGSAMYDVVIRSLAYAVAIVRKEADNVRQYSSVTKMVPLSDTTSRLAFEDIMSNWFIDRRQGGISKGSVRIYLSRPATLNISSSLELSRGISSFSPDFTTDSRTYLSTDFSEEVTQQAGVEVPIYYVEIPVKSNISGDGSLLIPGSFESNVPIPSLVKIVNTRSFSEVEEQETNSAMLERAKNSISHRGFITTKSIAATILDLNIPGITRSVACLAGDSEVVRDFVNPTGLELNLSTVDTLAASVFHGLGVCDVVVFPDYQDEFSKITSTAGGEIQISKGYPVGAVKCVSAAGQFSHPVSFLAAKTIYGDSCFLKTKLIYSVASDSYTLETSKQIGSTDLGDREFRLEYSGNYSVSSSVKLINLAASTEHSIYYDSYPTIATADSLIKSDGLKCAVGSVELRKPCNVILIIKKIRLFPSLTQPTSVFPVESIRIGLSRYIETRDQTTPLSLYDISKFIQDNYYQFVGAVDSSVFSAEYVVIDQDNSIFVPFETSNYVDVEDLSLLKKTSNIDTSTVFSQKQVMLLGFSNRSCSLICRPSNITIQVG
jgi:hypothetical protein